MDVDLGVPAGLLSDPDVVYDRESLGHDEFSRGDVDRQERRHDEDGDDSLDPTHPNSITMVLVKRTMRQCSTTWRKILWWTPAARMTIGGHDCVELAGNAD